LAPCLYEVIQYTRALSPRVNVFTSHGAVLPGQESTESDRIRMPLPPPIALTHLE